MKKKDLTRDDLESARAEIFHMILFALAWVMIGEYAMDFRDYAAGAAVVLAVSVGLGLRSIEIYKMEDELPNAGLSTRKPFRLYALIFLFEAGAIMATWMILLRLGHEDWLVPGFALVAGLHFIPLAAVIRVNSYYLLGAWICVLAAAGYLLPVGGKITAVTGNTLIAYGCAAGAIADGIWMVALTRKNR